MASPVSCPSTGTLAFHLHYGRNAEGPARRKSNVGASPGTPMARAVLFLVATTPVLAEPLMLPREWGAAIPLARVALIAPPAAVESLRDALAAGGAEVLIVAPDEALDSPLAWREELLARTVILVGGIHTNRALLPLYARYLAFGDAAWPGAGAFVVRTIARPFGAGTAAITVEATDDAGASAGVHRLCELVRAGGGRLPATFEAHLPTERLQALRGAHPAFRYALGGRPEDAEAAWRQLLDARHPERGWFDHGDYGIERWLRDYALLQDAPVGTPEDRLAGDNAVFATLRHSLDQFWRRRNGARIGGRHQTMGTGSFATGVLLLRRRGAPNEEAAALLEQWWTESQAYWANAASTFHDDLEGWPSYCSPEPTLDLALAMGLDSYPSEQLPLAVLRAYAVTDNMGWYAGTGTYEECRPGDVYKPATWGWLLRCAAGFHPGRGYRWLAEHFPNNGLATWAVGRAVAGARTFAMGVDEEAPTDWLGIVPVPLGPYRYQRLPEPKAPAEQWFEKLCFRDSFAPDGQYFVLSGHQVEHSDNAPPNDANSLIRFTDLGHVWLTANSEKQGNLHRTALACSDGTSAAPTPLGARLVAVNNGPAVGLAASRVDDYGGGDWTRHVIWRRGRYLVLIDRFAKSDERRLALVCSFRSPQKADPTVDGMILREGEAQMRIRCADPLRLTLDGGHDLEGAAIPTLLRESVVAEGGPGTAVVFRNLLYTSDPRHLAELEVRPVGDHAVLVRGEARGEHELALCAAGGQAPFETDGQVLYVGAAGWRQAGGTGLVFAGERLTGGSGPSTPAMRAALDSLWRHASPSVPPAAPPAPPAGQWRWRTDPFTPLAPAAPAPVLTAEPPADGLLGSLLDGIVTRWPTARWPAGPVTLSFDLRERRTIRGIDFQTGTTTTYNVVVEPEQLPPGRTVEIEFSDDAFQADRRDRTLVCAADCTYENIHKGSVFAVLRWTSEEIAETARYVRLRFAPEVWTGSLGLCELSVRVDGPAAQRVAGAIRRDVDGDGADETVLWSDRAELAVVRDDGRVALRRRMTGAITAVECYPDLAPEPRLLVTTREARLYCLTPDGRECWQASFLDSAKLNADLPIGYSLGLVRDPAGQPVIVVGNYNLASYVSADGEVLAYKRLPGAFQTLTAHRGADGDGDGIEEIASAEVWGTLSVLGADRRLRATTRCPRGRGVALEYLEPPSTDRARLLVCTENGLGVLNLRTLKFDWQRDLTPIDDLAIGDLDGDGSPEIVLAKHDGWMLVLGADGEVRRSVLLGEPVRAVVVVPTANGPAVVAALPDRVVRLADDGDEAAVLATGECLHLLPAGTPGEVLAVGGDGRVGRLRVP